MYRSAGSITGKRPAFLSLNPQSDTRPAPSLDCNAAPRKFEHDCGPHSCSNFRLAKLLHIRLLHTANGEDPKIGSFFERELPFEICKSTKRKQMPRKRKSVVHIRARCVAACVRSCHSSAMRIPPGSSGVQYFTSVRRMETVGN